MDQEEYEQLCEVRDILKNVLIPSFGANSSIGTILTSTESRIKFFDEHYEKDKMYVSTGGTKLSKSGS